jgi:hypothetical protein
MIKPYLVVCLFLFSLTLVGQSSKNCEINLRVENRTYYKQFFVKLIRDKTSILIEYKIRIKENNEQRENDPRTIRAREDILRIKNLTPQNDSFLRALDKLNSIYLDYTAYRTDTLKLLISSFPTLNKIIDNLLITPTDSLQESGHVYLDGTSFTFEIKTKSGLRTVYANSVNKNNYRQLSEFVNATMEVYRSTKKNDFLDRSSTAGY